MMSPNWLWSKHSPAAPEGPWGGSGKEGQHPGGREGGMAFLEEGWHPRDTPGPAQPETAGHCHLATGKQ